MLRLVGNGTNNVENIHGKLTIELRCELVDDLMSVILLDGTEPVFRALLKLNFCP